MQRPTRIIAAALLTLIATGCSQKEYVMGNDVNTHVSTTIAAHDVKVKELKIQVSSDRYQVLAEGFSGETAMGQGFFPSPNFYHGYYTVTYRCTEQCAVYLDSRAASRLSDTLVSSLFDEYTSGTLKHLALKTGRQVARATE